MSITKLALIRFSSKIFLLRKVTFSLLIVLQYFSLLESSLCQFPGNFYQLFIPTGSTILENTRILSGILNVYSKTKMLIKKKSAGEKEVLLQNNKKELQYVLPWNLELLTPTSARVEETSCTKSKEKKFSFQNDH